MELQGSLHPVVEKAHHPAKGLNAPYLEVTCSDQKKYGARCALPPNHTQVLVLALESLSLCQEHLDQDTASQIRKTVLGESPWIPYQGKVGLGRECERKPGN